MKTMALVEAAYLSAREKIKVVLEDITRETSAGKLEIEPIELR